MNDLSAKEEFSVKLQKFFKENISVIALIVVSSIYIFYGIITIDKTGKSVSQIIADGAISFLIGFVIKILLNNQGLGNGEKSDNFQNARNFYLKILDEVAPIQHYLPRYCELENEKTLKRVQTAILRKENLKYDLFINNEYDLNKLDKKQVKAIYKARSVVINAITDAVLLSDCQLNLDTGKDLSVSKKNYLKSSNAKTLIIMLLVALLFGYYGIDPTKGFNWSGAIWSAIQVALYLALGAMQYFQGFSFMADTYKTALVRKSNHLERFKNMYNENPNLFKEEEIVEKENKEQLLNQKIKDLELQLEKFTKEENEKNNEEQ